MPAKRRQPQRPVTESPPAVVAISTLWTWLAPVTIGMGAVLAFVTSLGNGLVWDDPIILSRQLVIFRSVGDVLLPPRGIPQFSPDYYRPLTIASYLLDRALGGQQPLAYHLSVVLFHALTAVLVYFFGRQLLGRDLVGTLGAFTAGALFAVHPVHTESVAWVAGRSDVLATCCLLAALVLHGRLPWSWPRSAVTGALALAALGAKEIGVTLYPLMLLYDTLAVPAGSLRGRQAGDWLRGYAGVLAAAAIYLPLRRATLGEFIGPTQGEATAVDSLPDILGAIGLYVGKLVWPVDLNAYIDHVPKETEQLALSVLVLLVAGAIGWWWRKRAQGVPLFLLVWVGLTLIPSLTIVWKIPDAPVAERFLYLPSVGFCLLVGYAVMRAWAAWPTTHARAAIAAGVAAVLVIGAAGTLRRNRVWNDDVTLWEDTARKSRISGMALRSLGTAYQKRGRLAEARNAFDQALQRRNTVRGLQIIHNNLGTIAMYEQDFIAAQRHYKDALAINPNAPDTLFNLGLVVLQGGGRGREAADAAIPHFLRAQKLSPYDPDIDAVLGQAFAATGQKERAVHHLRRALQRGLQPATANSVKAFLATLESAQPALGDSPG